MKNFNILPSLQFLLALTGAFDTTQAFGAAKNKTNKCQMSEMFQEGYGNIQAAMPYEKVNNK